MEVDITLLTAAGFDLVHPFDAHAVAREVGVAMLADPERPLGYLVGNTRALWPTFLAARRAQPELAASANPVDLYTEKALAHASGARCLFVHRRYAGGYLPFQRIAAAAGLATIAPSNLAIHPIYGPWFALRAIVLVAGKPVTRLLPRAACDCATTCTKAFERACTASGPQAWRAWLAVRDACCVGLEHRYRDDQLAYHYTKDLRLLEE